MLTQEPLELPPCKLHSEQNRSGDDALYTLSRAIKLVHEGLSNLHKRPNIMPIAFKRFILRYPLFILIFSTIIYFKLPTFYF